MKTFNDLIEEVQKPGLCHRCGGCVTFCTAVNFGALELDSEGNPRYADEDKCIECGLCHTICPEIDELVEETQKRLAWQPPIGRVLETSISRSTDANIRQKATDGGVVTALLVDKFLWEPAWHLLINTLNGMRSHYVTWVMGLYDKVLCMRPLI